MPSADVSITYTRQDLGMGLEEKKRYEDKQYAGSTIIDNQAEISGGCCCTNKTYPNGLEPVDVDSDTERKLQSEFPRFSRQIHRLIEDRREHMKKLAEKKEYKETHPNKDKCVIL